MNNKRSGFIVFATSATLIAFQIIFVRLFAIIEWQNYIALVISMALLGFGVSGTLMTIVKEWIMHHMHQAVIGALFLYLLSLMVGLILYAKIPFNPFELSWSFNQFNNFLLHFFVLLLPFTGAALLIGIHFLQDSPVATVYFANLLGSGVGGLLALLLLTLVHPTMAMIGLVYLIALLVLYYVFQRRRHLSNIILLLLIPCLICFTYYFPKTITISQYKGLATTMNMPKAKIEAQRFSPLGLVQVVSAKGLRSVNGLSYNFMGSIPEQKGLFFDSDNMSPITPFDDDLKKLKFLKYTTSALPYHIGSDQIGKSLIVGAGGGEGILRSLAFETQHISAVEINGKLIDLMQHELANYSGNIYNHNKVRVIHADARQFIQSTKQHFDIIEISLLDSFVSASAGTTSLSESYLYTLESLAKYYHHLSDQGVLAITRWIKEPPRDMIKLFATVVAMLEQQQIVDIEKKVALIRSANTATLCVSQQNIDTDNMRRFCQDKSFDLVYLSDIKPEEINRYFQVSKPELAEACQHILSPKRSEFYNDYPFMIKPATDNQPYYYNFMKIKTFMALKELGVKKIPFTEWGYFILIIILLPVILISFTLIILPLFFNKVKRSVSRSNFGSVCLYFFAIGLAFFFVEMPLIQKFTLYLGHPTYAMASTIAGLLMFSGLGSYLSSTIQKKYRLIVFIMLSILLMVYGLILDQFFMLSINQPLIIKIVISLIILSGLGMLMGMPFPIAITMLKFKQEQLVPWAWGINGFASVLSVLIASIFAVAIGFTNVMMMAGVLYLGAGLILINQKFIRFNH